MDGYPCRKYRGFFPCRMQQCRMVEIGGGRSEAAAPSFNSVILSESETSLAIAFASVRL